MSKILHTTITACRRAGIELRQFKNLQKMNKQTNDEGLHVSPTFGKQMLAAAYRRRRDFGWLLIIIGNVFGFLETQYFGWNWTPQTKAEYVCDGVAMCLTIFGVYLLLTSKRLLTGSR